MRIKQTFAGVILLCAGQVLFAADKRPLAVEDAVGTHRIADNSNHGEVAMSPDGSAVAYIVKAPDVQNNRNNYQLFVRALAQTERPDNGRLLFQADRLSQLQWVGSGHEIGVISTETVNRSEQDKLILLNLKSGRRKIIESPTKRIRSFSINAEGDRIVFSAGLPPTADLSKTENQNRYGFRVAPGEPINDPSLITNWFPRSSLYLVERPTGGELRVTALQPLGPSKKPIDILTGEVTDLALSPDGRFLIFKYETKAPPEGWTSGFYGKFFSSFSIRLWGFMDLNDNSFRVAFDAPAESYMPVSWSADSHAFVLSSLPPEGSSWQKQDFDEGLYDPRWQLNSYLHLFAVEVDTHAVSEVLHKYAGRDDAGIVWTKSDGALFAVVTGGLLARMERKEGKWTETSRSTLFDEPNVTFQGISKSGAVAIGVREDIDTPPNLVVRDLRKRDTRTLTDLNPQYQGVDLGSVERIDWLNKYGIKCWGYLIKPAGYVPGKKYPLVIMNKPRDRFFVSDTSYTTAFPPQPLAGEGFAVLMVQYGLFEPNDLPKGFPGGLTEAFNFTALVESGANYLVDRGMVDKNEIGIIGFSRTSWKTDFMLTHSEFKFAAASSADSGIYNYGAYWLWNHQGSMADDEEMLGGPPYGKTLENWLKYAPAFNAQHVQCPILMEYTGHGHSPFGPIGAFEFFTALYRQDKPVELYFYPLGDHPLDTPSERVASLQRNVDWFRFWLQGREGKAPEYDPGQYARWRELRKLQEESSGHKQASSSAVH